jgi:hypothetical protein
MSIQTRRLSCNSIEELEQTKYWQPKRKNQYEGKEDTVVYEKALSVSVIGRS